MNRLEQDAADALEAYEFQQAERARWARAQSVRILGTWAPVMNEQQKQEFQQYSAKFQLPF